MRKIQGIKSWIEGYDKVKTLSDELALAYDFQKEDLITEDELDSAYSKEIGRAHV